MKVYENPYFFVSNQNNYYSIEFWRENVLVLPIVDGTHILFIKAIRPLLGKFSIELPAGNVEKGEDLKDAALRELHEETGVHITETSRLTVLPSLNLIPNRTIQMLNIYRIDISIDEYRNRAPHDDEVEGLLLLSFKEVVSRINKGEIVAAAAVASSLNYILNNEINYF